MNLAAGRRDASADGPDGRRDGVRLSIAVDGVTRRFNGREIFRPATFTVRAGEVVGITGRNGAGKSTLLKIMAGVLGPSRGRVAYEIDGRAVDGDRLRDAIGFAAPYLALFEEFSAEENLRIAARIRGIRLGSGDAAAMLERVGLPPARRDPIRAYSSGMKQRVKLCFATLHEPPVLLLDEPATNLDADGIADVAAIVEAQRARGCTVIATNDEADIARCDRTQPVVAPGAPR
jgi:heme exporter protein A